MSNALDELRNRLIGKTVIAIDPPNAAEAIAKFTMSDGSVFRLHATDLGFWIEDTVKNGNTYKDFHTLFTDVYHYRYQTTGISAIPKVKITRQGIEPTLQIITSDGKVFAARIDQLSEWEQSVCNHPKAKYLIEESVQMGDCWQLIFKKGSMDCPEELTI